MQNLIYLIKYNNYYNRKFGAPLDLVWVNNNRDKIVYSQQLNFVPGDGVSTEVILNVTESMNFNYALVLTQDVQQEGIVTLSHWFVVKSIRTRQGQYKLQLYRDLVADAYDDLLDAPMFVEKAYLEEDDPFIFNSEQMTFNQIKQSAILLPDDATLVGGAPLGWIVGYYNKNDSRTFHFNYNSGTDIDASNKTKDEYLSEHSTAKLYDNLRLRVIGKTNQSLNQAARYIWGRETGILESQDANVVQSSYLNISTRARLDEIANYGLFHNNNYNMFEDVNFEQLNIFVRNEFNMSLENPYKSLDNKTIKFSDGIYKIHVVLSASSEENTFLNDSSGQIYINVKDEIIHSIYNKIGETPTAVGQYWLWVQWHMMKYDLELEFISDGLEDDIQFEFAETRQHLTDAPYDLFFMENNEKNLAIANQIMLDADTHCYDVQLLPYCPSISTYLGPHTDGDKNWVRVTKGNDPNFSQIFFAARSSNSYTIDIRLGLEFDKKIEAETKMYRLVSPNYNGIFEFSVAKNEGVSNFKVDFTYKPYNPYIHVCPEFKGLYGADFEDARGLILGGDFSLPRIRDAFNAYEIQNKYYQEIFDRNIQSMEFNNNFALANDITNAFTGTFAGAAAGGMMGGVPGAVVGGVLSGVGGVADVFMSQSIRNEAMDLTKDQFGYTLGNIKALPQSISKTTAITINNKIVPFVEIYGCTEKERQALRDKIKYNGMTVMRIGTLREFNKPFETYIKGKLIRLDSEEYDNNYVNALANELNQGIYIKKEDFEE